MLGRKTGWPFLVGMGWDERAAQSQSQSSLGLEWRFRQTLSFSLNKRQLTSFSFLAFMHCVRLMCVSVCQPKPSHPIHLGIGIVHFPKTNNPHSYNNNIAFLLMMTHALSYAQSQLWLRFFFLRASLSLSSSLDCVLGKCKLWLPWSAYCMLRYTMRYTEYPYTIFDICVSTPIFHFLLAFCNWWGFICAQMISRSVSRVLLIQNVSGNGILSSSLSGDSANCLIIGWHVKIQVLVIYGLLDKLR